MSIAPEPVVVPPDHLTVFAHEGEMGRLCREMDWSATPLGPVTGWSYSLRATVATVLASRHPMFLFWGPDLVQFYNDGYRPSLGEGGRHPRALGMRGAEFWTEIWDIIGPQIEQVMTTGEATWHVDQLVAIERNGRMEEVYWTYSYSPVRDDDGSIGATLVVCQETTAQVLAERRLRTLNAVAAVPLQATGEETAAAGTRALAAEPRDLPFALCYVVPDDDPGAPPALAAAAGIAPGAWTRDPALAEAISSGREQVLDVSGWAEAAALGPWPEPPRAAAVVPLGAQGAAPVGILVAGLSPRLPWDESYRTFLAAAAAQIGARAVERRTEVQRERLLRALELERSRLEFVFQRAPAFLAVLRGPEHVITLANEAYYQLVGHRDLLGKPAREALPEIRGQGFLELLDSVLRSGEPYIGREVPVMLARTPGAAPEQRFVDFSYLPLLEGEGVRAGIIAHGTDVTGHVLARREVERLLAESERARGDAEAARAEAESANRAKAEFLTAMSHELRTPLNAIGGYTELLEMGIHGPVTDAQREALHRVLTSQRHLLTLINDILTHARLEAGRVEFDLRPLSARELLDSVEPLVAPQAAARGVAYTAQPCPPELQILADEERTRQVLLNLVGNAIKFTDPGGWVSLSCQREGDEVRVTVRDNGRGIPPDKLEAVFDPFMQVGRRLNKPEAGVGLGLAISRDLARGMGGDLRAESAEGGGSTFTLTLPAA